MPTVNESYVVNQVPGCAIKLYKNDGTEKTEIFYFSIQNCRAERSTTDVNGAFQFTLIPDRVYDEIISPDDFVRIFMGDDVVQSKIPGGGFNISSGKLGVSLDARKAKVDAKNSVIEVPFGSGKAKNSYLIMYERFFGKVDRVQRMEQATPNGTITSFVVSGRSFASILQDITLYYNEHIVGLNTLNLFRGISEASLTTVDPSTLLKSIISLVLTIIPFPQWQIPKSLIDDFDSDAVRSQREQAKEFLKKYEEDVKTAQEAKPYGGNQENFLSKMRKLMSEAGSNGYGAYSILSLGGFAPTAGKNFNRSWSNSEAQTTGLLTLLKSLSNDLLNEFWFDMCPYGKPNGGNAADNPLMPTLVMRQRPYDISNAMLNQVSKYLEGPAETLKETFPREEITQDGKYVSLSLHEMTKGAFAISGPVSKTDFAYAIEKANPKQKIEYTSATPSVLSYEVGLSGHDRQNSFYVAPILSNPAMQMTHKLFAAENAINVDLDSVKRYGFRFFEGSTPYVQNPSSASEAKDGSHIDLVKKFTKAVGNWYYLNPWLLNGTIVCRFLPQARIGVPCYYVNTVSKPGSPPPRVELFYVQSVSDEYTIGQPLKTTLQVIRGIRYDISGNTKQVSGGPFRDPFSQNA